MTTDSTKRLTTKEKILFAALDLISQKGYDGVGVDLIAEHAGLKGPSLYRHFKGKEDIFNSMLDMLESYYEKEFAEAEGERHLPENLSELIQISLQKIDFTMHDEIIQKTRRLLAMEQFRNPRVARLTTRHHLEKLQALYAVLFAKLMEKGMLKRDNPEVLALSFVAPVTLLIHIYDRQPEREAEVMEKIQEHFAHFVKTYENGEKMLIPD